MHRHKIRLVSWPQNQHLNYTTGSVTLHETPCLCIHFWKSVVPKDGTSQTEHVDAVGCDTFYSELISMFVFGILQIPSRCIRICSGCIAPTCTPLAKGPDFTHIFTWATHYAEILVFFHTTQCHVSDDGSPNTRTDFRNTSNIAATEYFCGFN